MDTYIVNYRENFPGAGEYDEEDLNKTAFVRAGSFQEAAEKVEKAFKKESESVTVKAVALSECSIIL